MTAVDVLEPMTDPRTAMAETIRPNGDREWHGQVALAHLVTGHQLMTETLNSGRASLSPKCPIELCLRADTPGRFEVVDGHHRIAEAIRNNSAVIDAVIYDYTDGEPYQGPYFSFTSAATTYTETNSSAASSVPGEEKPHSSFDALTPEERDEVREMACEVGQHAIAGQAAGWKSVQVDVTVALALAGIAAAAYDARTIPPAPQHDNGAHTNQAEETSRG